MSVWVWAGIGYGLLAAFGSLFLIWASGNIGAKQAQSMPVDDMVDIVAETDADFAARLRLVAAEQAAEVDKGRLL